MDMRTTLVGCEARLPFYIGPAAMGSTTLSPSRFYLVGVNPLFSQNLHTRMENLVSSRERAGRACFTVCAHPFLTTS